MADEIIIIAPCPDEVNIDVPGVPSPVTVNAPTLGEPGPKGDPGDDAITEDAAYGPTWDGDQDAASKNAIFDKIESLTGPKAEKHVTRNLTANGAMTAADSVVFCTGTFTVTLPTAVGIAGTVLSVLNQGAGTITVLPDGSETIQGEASQSVGAGDNLRVISNNIGWRFF